MWLDKVSKKDARSVKIPVKGNLDPKIILQIWKQVEVGKQHECGNIPGGEEGELRKSGDMVWRPQDWGLSRWHLRFILSYVKS